MFRTTSFLLSAAVIVAYISVPAQAQIPVGLRAGVSADPDQFFFGAHVEIAPLLDEIAIRFRPNVEAGFGDDQTLLGFNAEFVYPISVSGGYTVHLGAGPAINVISFDRNPPSRGRKTNVEPGFNFLAGIELPNLFFAELKAGVIDSPGIKFSFGYTFR